MRRPSKLVLEITDKRQLCNRALGDIGTPEGMLAGSTASLGNRLPMYLKMRGITYIIVTRISCYLGISLSRLSYMFVSIIIVLSSEIKWYWKDIIQSYKDGFNTMKSEVFQIMSEQTGNWKLFFMMLSNPSNKKQACVLVLKYLIFILQMDVPGPNGQFSSIVLNHSMKTP